MVGIDGVRSRARVIDLFDIREALLAHGRAAALIGAAVSRHVTVSFGPGDRS
jgi:hypothetical protein